MERQIRALKNHQIICGYGRMGSAVAEIFEEEKIPFVVIEHDNEAIETLKERSHLFIKGDATTDEALEMAGTRAARCIIPMLRSDADNLFVTLSARQMNPSISIVVRAQDESGARKLMRAGATRVITPYLAGAHRLASAALRPAYMDFIEALSGGGAPEFNFRFEELLVQENSPVVRRTLASLNLGQEYGVIIVAIMRKDGSFVFNPGGKTELHQGDTLISIGTADQFARMRSMLHGGD